MAENNNRSGGISFDVTKGVPTDIPSNDEKVAKATIINPGAVPANMDNMQKVNLNDILPRKQKEEAPTVEDEMMGLLDLAVEKEKASITERHKALAEKQMEELEAQKEKEDIDLLDEDIDSDYQVATKSDVSYEPEKTYNYTQSPSVVEADEEDYYDENVTELGENNTDNSVIDNVESYTEVDDSNDNSITEALVTKADNNNMPIKSADSVNDDESIDITVREEENSNVPMKDIRIIENIDNDHLMEEDDESSDDDTSDDDDDRELMNNIRDVVKDKITPIKKTFDLSKFTIAKKADSAQKILKLAVNSHRIEADWIMYNANRPVSVTGLSGPEIIKLNPDNSSRNRLNTFKDMYRIIYEHIVDGNKPEFEVWLKQTKYVDVQHIVFALYMATFNGSNFTTFSCPECKHVFLKDFKFEDMVSYANEETKDKVRAILKMDTTSPSKSEYNVDLVQISDTLVFGLRTPSIYNTIIETASLSEDFLRSYSSFIDTIAFIDSVYYINEKTNELVPVDTKPVANDIAKTTGRRVKILHSIINNLTSEEYTYLVSKIAEINNATETNVSYKVPGCVCPKCAKEIEEQANIDPIYLLFTRHQLGVIRNM